MSFVTGNLCERLWAACTEAGRPVPQLSHDDVVDFMVVEAMTAKIREAKVENQERAERKQRLKSHRQMRGMKPGDKQVNL